jgi:hypothetical protein
MADIIVERDVDIYGYEVESVWGTDLATTRLPIPGIVETAKLLIRENKAAYKGSGSGGYDPAGFYRKAHDVELSVGMIVQDDKPSNSLLGLALGSAPDAGTGVITNYPDATNANLRSFTLEMGYTWPGTDRYYLARGCMIRRLEMAYRESLLRYLLNIVVKDVPAPSSSRAAAAPSLLTVSPFDCYEDSTLTFANPTISNHHVDEFKIVIENKLRTGRKVGQADRGLGSCQFAGRDVFLEMNQRRMGSDFEDLYLADPSTVAADVDVTAVLSKNAAAEYISAVLTNCQVIGDWGPEYRDVDEEMKDAFRLQAKSYAFDAKS